MGRKKEPIGNSEQLKMTTAVEWLIENLGLLEAPDHVIKKARAMEKAQIIHAWENGALPDLLKEFKNSRTYYNQNYEQ